jgi:hypothetical protein
MKEVIQLLKEKNHFLEKFYRLNEVELLNFVEGKFEGLEVFYNQREGLLDMIKKVDEMIDNSGINAILPDEIQAVDKREILNCLSLKNELVTRILSQDLQILSYIETVKSQIIKELSQVRAARKVMGHRSGGGNRRLDEEY